MNRGASLDELLAAEKIENADFTQRELPGGLSFAGRALISCLFDGAALSRRGLHSAAALERCSFRGADLPDAAFDEAELADCDFTGAKLGGARFVRAKLARVSLDGVGYAARLLPQKRIFGVRVELRESQRGYIHGGRVEAAGLRRQ